MKAAHYLWIATITMTTLIYAGCQAANDVRFVETRLGRVASEEGEFPGEMLPDAQSAANVAYAYLVNGFGKREARLQLPLRIALVGDIWVIEGAKKRKEARGGAIHLELSRKDGRVVAVKIGL